MRPQGVRNEKGKLFLGRVNKIIREILIQICLQDIPSQSLHSSMEIMRAAGWIFESGFTGFIGLTITSLD